MHLLNYYKVDTKNSPELSSQERCPYCNDRNSNKILMQQILQWWRLSDESTKCRCTEYRTLKPRRPLSGWPLVVHAQGQGSDILSLGLDPLRNVNVRGPSFETVQTEALCHSEAHQKNPYSSFKGRYLIGLFLSTMVLI